LKLLIENKSNIVTFEEVAKIYWNEEWNNKYSLYSLAKVIEKLRKTMKENKVPLNYLLTVRKRGYMLYD
ncbi:MAG: helix-turn-helix domain-containing protein, partial [bacterium]